MRLAHSNTVAILILTQMVSLLSLLFWGSLLVIILKNNGEFNTAGLGFAIYPVVPLLLSIAAWLVLRQRRYQTAVIFSSIPALIAFALMLYYYIIGISQH